MEQEVRNQEALIYLPHYAPLSESMLSNKNYDFEHRCKIFHFSLKLRTLSICIYYTAPIYLGQ